jgi:hypothetical protein
MREARLTTVDNPFDPFDSFDDWYRWDTTRGYNSSSYVARIAYIPWDATEIDQNFAIETAIDEIVSENITGMYKKIVRE